MDIKSRLSANPILILAVGITAVSFSALMVRLISAPPAVTAFWRLTFTCLLLGPFIPVQEVKRMGRSDLLFCLLSGFFLALHFSFWFASLGWTSISSSTLLVNIHPLVVVALGFLLFGENVRSRAIPGAALALGGMALLGWGDLQLTGDAIKGDLLAAAGGLMLAGYYLVGRWVRSRVGPLSYSFIVYAASALFLLAFNLLAGAELFSWPGLDWLLFVALALIPTIAGHTMINWALGHMPASAVSVSVLGEPVIATLLATLFLSEIPGLFQGAGALAVILGIWYFLRHR